ncbi:uncharacterized protein LOC5515534 isoform X2 [Nematostella vectensis]|uniref:uncharacterized protein LOC5515534 isoform X2 n=1 Tax=Nematostella vectensis TaxID=45351 RepID=UPI0020770042|nr:uncharacterized protein LOC5515534 isoform X2 [Nematostella vectensis]
MTVNCFVTSTAAQESYMKALKIGANVKQRVRFAGHYDVIDLADETGTLKNLSDRPIQQYALEYLTSRASYILMKVKKSEDALGVESKSYEPLLRGIQENNPDFMAKVYNKKINPDVTQSAPTRVTSSLPSKQPIKSSKTSRSQTKAAPSNARLNAGGKGKRLH